MPREYIQMCKSTPRPKYLDIFVTVRPHITKHSVTVMIALIHVRQKLTRSLGAPRLQLQDRHGLNSFPKVQNVNTGVSINAGCANMVDVAFLTPRAKYMNPHA